MRAEVGAVDRVDAGQAQGSTRPGWSMGPVALGLLGLLLVLFFPFWSSPDGVLFSTGADFFDTHLGARLLLADSLRTYGVLPTWSPYWFGGAPVTGEWSNGWTYPLNWLHALVGHDGQIRLYDFLILAHLWLGGCGMAWFLRRERLSRPACCTGAVAFMLNGKWIAYALLAQQPVLAWCWLPWVLGWSLRLDSGRPREMLGLGACLCLFALGLNPTFLFVAAYFLVAWFAALLLRSRRRGVFLVSLSVAVVWSLLAASLSLLPARGYAGNGTRSQALTLDQIAALELPPSSVPAEAVLPRPLQHDGARDWEMNLYCGAAVVALAAAGVRRKPRPAFFLGAAVVALLCCVGRATPLYGWGYAHLPGWSFFRIPPRWGLLLGPCLAYLAAGGLERAVQQQRAVLGAALLLTCWLAASSGWGLAWLAPLAVAGMLLALLTPKVWRGWLVCLVVTVELGLGVARGLEVRPESSIFPPNPVARQLASAARGGSRVLNADPLMLGLTPAYRAGIESMNTVSSTIPLSTFRWAQQGVTGMEYRPMFSFSLPEPQPNFPDFFSRANVSALVTSTNWNQLGDWPQQQQVPFTAYSVRGTTGYQQVGPVRIYQNPHPLPRHRLVGLGRACASVDQAFAQAAHTDPRRELQVEATDAPRGTDLALPLPEVACQWLSFSRRRLTFQVPPGAGCYLFVSEFYYPGWKAKENGQSVPLWRADGAFLAAFFAPGSHQLDLDYQPDSWTWGCRLSLAAWLVWLLSAAALSVQSLRIRSRAE